MAVAVVVTEVEPSRTFRLRQQVLRPHKRIEEMSLFDDDDPDTGIFAAIETGSGEVVGTANVRRAAPPRALRDVRPDTAAAHPWRLRGMATREDLRGQGIGRKVLAACVDHVASKGGGLLWCNARLRARGFYGREGFFQAGEVFDEAEIGPHVVMWRLVEPSAAVLTASSGVSEEGGRRS